MRLTPENSAIFLETAVAKELSKYYFKVAQWVQSGLLSEDSRIYTAIRSAQNSWHDKNSYTPSELIDAIEKAEIDLRENEESWLLYCLLSFLVDDVLPPKGYEQTEIALLDRKLHPKTKRAKRICSLWLDLACTPFIFEDSPNDYKDDDSLTA